MRSDVSSRKPTADAIDLLVMALTLYVALSVGVMQFRSVRAPIEHSAVSISHPILI